MTNHKTHRFPRSRIATIDIGEIGKKKHHVTGLIEIDVSQARKSILEHNKSNNQKISFTSWIISVISKSISRNETSASFLKGKDTLMIFDNINVSLLIEKDLNGQKIPLPVIIKRAQEKSIETISKEINDAKNKQLTDKDIVLQKKTGRLERIYYFLPGFIRRLFWKYLLKHPELAYRKMGNVAITSIGMMGNIKGWFIPISIHPICFGIGSIVKKPTIINDEIEIREILHMSILLDHDVMDGTPMVRFISDLTHNIESGINL